MARKADSGYTVGVKITLAPDAVRRYSEILRILRDVYEKLKQVKSEDVAQLGTDLTDENSVGSSLLGKPVHRPYLRLCRN